MQATDELAAKRRTRLLGRIEHACQGLTEADLYILQHDVLSRPTGSRIPAVLKESFFSWLDDSYGPIERETRMAPENQGETEAAFLEESVDSDDVELAQQARMLLKSGRLQPMLCR
jgi:hypothetical protein